MQRGRSGFGITDVLSCSNLCCESLLFVLLSFLLLARVPVQARSKLLITSFLDRILSVIHVRVSVLACLLKFLIYTTKVWFRVFSSTMKLRIDGSP